MNNYYVYIYYRLDTNEPFYVGKGKDDRWKVIKRENTHFNNIVNKYPIAVEIIKNNLTEEESFYWEEEIIRQLVFEYGYSINIKNNRSSKKNMHLVNSTWGGEGTSGYNHTVESKERMSENKKGKYCGENHHMYGKHHTEVSKCKNRISNSGKNHIFSKCVICITTNMVFYSLREAGRYYNISHTGIGYCCKGIKYKFAGKLSDDTPLVWRYLEVIEL